MLPAGKDSFPKNGGRAMKGMKMTLVVAMILSLAMVGSGFNALSAAKEIPRVSIDELKGMLDAKDYVLVDVRAGKDWSSSELKIKGAVREDPKEFDSWAAKYPKEKRIILYCA
jgi:hypothetical protein